MGRVLDRRDRPADVYITRDGVTMVSQKRDAMVCLMAVYCVEWAKKS